MKGPAHRNWRRERSIAWCWMRRSLSCVVERCWKHVCSFGMPCHFDQRARPTTSSPPQFPVKRRYQEPSHRPTRSHAPAPTSGCPFRAASRHLQSSQLCLRHSGLAPGGVGKGPGGGPLSRHGRRGEVSLLTAPGGGPLIPRGHPREMSLFFTMVPSSPETSLLLAVAVLLQCPCFCSRRGPAKSPGPSETQSPLLTISP